MWTSQKLISFANSHSNKILTSSFYEISNVDGVVYVFIFKSAIQVLRSFAAKHAVDFSTSVRLWVFSVASEVKMDSFTLFLRPSPTWRLVTQL